VEPSTNKRLSREWGASSETTEGRRLRVSEDPCSGKSRSEVEPKPASAHVRYTPKSFSCFVLGHDSTQVSRLKAAKRKKHVSQPMERAYLTKSVDTSLQNLKSALTNVLGINFHYDVQRRIGKYVRIKERGIGKEEN
jgi:hypothetical protein